MVVAIPRGAKNMSRLSDMMIWLLEGPFGY